MGAWEIGTPETYAPEAEALEARGEGFELAADGEAPTDGSEAAAQKTPRAATPHRTLLLPGVVHRGLVGPACALSCS